MTRTVVTGLVCASLLGCTFSTTTKLHMEEVEGNAGAAGEASTAAEEGNDTSGSTTTAGGSHGDADSR